MVTRVIGFGDRLVNIFTKYGRNRNHLFKELKSNGINHIRERKLPDNSRVILGYKNESSKKADYAFMVKPDLTLEQKTVSSSYILNGLGDTNLYISKVWADNTGEKVKEEFRNLKYRNNRIVGKTKSTLNNEYSTVHAEGEGIGRLSAITNDIKKLYKREAVRNSDKYQMIQYKDGSRLYEKRIGDVEYTFSTKA